MWISIYLKNGSYQYTILHTRKFLLNKPNDNIGFTKGQMDRYFEYVHETTVVGTKSVFQKRRYAMHENVSQLSTIDVRTRNRYVLSQRNGRIIIPLHTVDDDRDVLAPTEDLCPGEDTNSSKEPSSRLTPTSPSALEAVLRDPEKDFTHRYDAALSYLDSLAKPVGSLGTTEDLGRHVLQHCSARQSQRQIK